MPAAIKLIRVGKRGKPNYRIVVMDKRKKRTGAYLEKIGKTTNKYGTGKRTRSR